MIPQDRMLAVFKRALKGFREDPSMEKIRVLYKLDDVEKYNREFNRNDYENNSIQFKLQAKVDYAVVFVDLATMLEEFGSGEAKDYEKAVNLLHPVAKRTNTHIVLVVQAVQKTLENHRPTTLQGINLFRPTLASIKNSSALSSIFCPCSSVPVWKKTSYP